MDKPTIAVALVVGLSAAFWLGHYNENHKADDGWAWLWLSCLLLAGLRMCGILS